MRRAIFIVIFLSAGLMGRPAFGQSAATFPVRGTVSISTGLDLEKPDLSRAVVYLDSTPALDAAPLPTTRPMVAQRNKEFVPNFLVIPKGTTVEFPNFDNFDHNVFSRSPAAPAFDLDRYGYGESKSSQFVKVGVVQLFCNIHPSMKAIILVTPNLFFAQADAKGNFQINGVPAGHYQLWAWQERCALKQQAIDVGPGAAKVNFQLGEDRHSILLNDPPRREQAYGGVDRGLGVKREKLDLPVVGGEHPAPTTQPCPLCN